MYQPIITKKAMIFEFEKPIYGSTFSIYEKWLKLARRANLKIVAKSEFGTATYTVDEWLEGAKRIEKVHNIPGVPMVMFSRSILPDIKERTKRKKKEKKEKVLSAKFGEAPDISRDEFKHGVQTQLEILKVVLGK